MALSFLAVVTLAGALLALSPGLRQRALGRLPPAWQVALSAWRNGVEVDHGIRIAMPDGVSLTASLYLPKGSLDRLPVVLIRTPYDRLRHGEATSFAIFFAARGYASLVLDLRGSGGSGGVLMPWALAREDGVATLDWIASQTWSNGRVGTIGCSALGETQLVLAAANHPAHQAMIPSGAGGAIGSAAGRYGQFGVFEGGVLQLASAFGWFVGHGSKERGAPPPAPFDVRSHLRELPVSSLVSRARPGPNGFTDFLATPLADPKWAEWGYLTDRDRPAVPALVVNTWGDQTVGETLAWAERLRALDPAKSGRQKTFVTAGRHCAHDDAGHATRFGEVPIASAGQPWNDLYLAWFDFWLRDRGDGLRQAKAYNVFLVGEDRWIASDEWPPREARLERWYLSSGAGANTAGGDGSLSRQPPASRTKDSFDYDPSDPVPSRGGPICCTGDNEEPNGPVDQADVERRRDVLVYTSEPLAASLRIVGPVRARLTVSSSAPDTDLVARLVHVRRDGRSLGIQEGALRLRYRDGFAMPTMMTPGRHYEVTVDMRSIAYAIPKGDRLRLHVTSSSFPRLERNLNTGAPNNAEETRMAIASNTLFHGEGVASWVELAVLPGGS